jgi:transposase-like protein
MGFSHDQETRDHAMALWHDKSLGIDDLEAATGVSRKTLRRWARAANLPHRWRGRSVFSAEVKARAVALYLQDPPLKMRTIEAKTGMDEQTIRDVVKAAGHTLRRTHTNARLKTNDVMAAVERRGSIAAAARELGCVPSSVQYHIEKARREKVRAELLDEQPRKRRRAA